MRFLLPLCCLVTPLLGEGVLPGHSSHGETFNEGPRQAAVLMEGMGKIDFPISVKNGEAQKFFNQGVGQLHGFWYYEAERSFRQAAMLDPDAAMAYWGCAMANVNNESRAKGFIAEAMKRKDKVSAREQAWINALNKFYDGSKRDKKQRHLDFIEDLEGIAQDYEDDLEAKAFLGWAIWKAKDGDVPMVSREAVNLVLNEVLKKEPAHPAHHYRIHLWDSGKAKRALDSAAQCGQSAPGIAHMWHMPAHTYSKTNRAYDSAWQQEAAIRVDHAYISRTRVLADQIHNYAHNAEWLIRSWNNLGRAGESIALAKNLLSMPRHPEGNTLEKENTSASYGRTRLLETLLKFELWDQMLELDGSPLLDITANRSHEIARLRAMGVAAFFANDQVKLAATIAKLESLEKSAPKKKEEAKDQKKAAANPDGKDKTKDGKPKPPDTQTALAELRVLKMIQNKAAKSDILAALEKLEKTPNERLVRYYQKIGEADKAVSAAEKLPTDAPGQALKADILFAFGKADLARAALEKAGKEGGQMDASLPFSRRLDELAAQMSIEGGWRKSSSAADDVGVRPEMRTIGSLHWQPVKALPLTLKDQAGEDAHVFPSQASAPSQPTLVIFYLSGQCSHCMEQLKAVQAAMPKLKSAGIRVVAVGNESVEALSETAKLISSDGKSDIRLLADPDLHSFKQWRCHDDFESSALHGTFLVDAKGYVRWQDISYTPFIKVATFVTEAQRLLKIGVQE